MWRAEKESEKLSYVSIDNTLLVLPIIKKMIWRELIWVMNRIRNVKIWNS